MDILCQAESSFGFCPSIPDNGKVDDVILQIVVENVYLLYNIVLVSNSFFAAAASFTASSVNVTLFCGSVGPNTYH